MKKSNIFERINILLLVLVLMISLIFTGCGKKSNDAEQTDIEDTEKEEGKGGEVAVTSPEEVTLRVVWWGSQERANLYVKALEEFTERNPHIKFETEFSPWDGYWDKMATYAAAGSLPDIFQHDYSKLSQYVENKLLCDLTPYVESGQLDLTNVDENLISSGKFEDKFYALPISVNSTGTIVNLRALEEANLATPKSDWTWEDYLDMGKTIYEKTGMLTDLPSPDEPQIIIAYFARACGNSLFSKDGKSLGFDDPSIIQDYFELELELLDSGITAPVEELLVQKPTEESNLVLGKSWAGVAWTNFAVTVSELAKDPIDLVFLPQYSKTTDAYLYLKPGLFFTVPETSEYKDEAVQVLNYWINDIEANRILKAENGVPVSSEVRKSLEDIVDENIKMTFDYIDEVSKSPYTRPIDPPDPASGVEVVEIMKEVNEKVLFKEVTPKDGAEEIMTRANEILSKQ